MKVTSWELQKLLEALEALVNKREGEGESSRSLRRLKNKLVSYGEQTGKLRGNRT